jgi:YesN/AraC family two-component response regulator
MYSVYIVDDEKLVVDDLLNSIPWLENGFEVIGYGTNVQTALLEITQKKPDVVFTDLKMPKFDGIELIKRLKKTGVEAEFIMLSAYQEFEACRSLLLMDGFDYRSKPLEQDAAALVLESLSRKLAKKRNQTPTVQFVPSQSLNFDDLVKYVTDNFHQKHTLKDLSDRFKINQSYICNLFAKHYESTLTMFITNLRMAEAKRLILNSDTQLKEISLYCGYHDYHNFCRVFKTHFGKAPSLYREAKK